MRATVWAMVICIVIVLVSGGFWYWKEIAVAPGVDNSANDDAASLQPQSGQGVPPLPPLPPPPSPPQSGTLQGEIPKAEPQPKIVPKPPVQSSVFKNGSYKIDSKY